MGLRRIDIAKEMRRAAKGKLGKRRKNDPPHVNDLSYRLFHAEHLLEIAAPYYLEAVEAAKDEAGERLDIAELERMFNLEDPRR